MSDIIIQLDNSAPQENMNTGIRREVLPVKYFCNGECDDQSLLCKCDHDMPFSYMAQLNDIIYLQWNITDTFNVNPLIPQYGWDEDGSTHWLELDLMNCDDTVALANITNAGQPLGIIHGFAVGYNVGIYFQNVNIRVTAELLELLNSDCFYFRLRACDRSLVSDAQHITVVEVFPGPAADAKDYEIGDMVLSDSTLLINTPSGWASVAPQPADGDYVWDGNNWWVNNGGTFEIDVTYDALTQGDCGAIIECNSAQYCIKKCQSLVCFETNEVTDYVDCEGKYYGARNATNTYKDWQYKNRFCIEGALEPTCYNSVREETDGGAVINNQMTSSHRLRAFVPEAIAKRIASMFMHQEFYVNDMPFQSAGEVCKNNDESSDWHIDTTLETTECELGVDECE